MKIAHISDLHVSSNYFVPEWADRVLSDMEREDVDLVIISGDLTMDGHPHEYDMAMELLDRMPFRKVVVPGNHDAMNGGYEIFEEVFGTRKPFFENGSVAICGMDSSEPDIHEGQIGRHNYPIIRQRLEAEKATIMVLHHHVIPVPRTGRECNILSDAGDVLSLLVDLKVDLVLSGHRHLPWVWELQNSYFVTAGTACTRRLKGRTDPSYNMIRLTEENVILDRVNVRTGKKTEMIEKTLKKGSNDE